MGDWNGYYKGFSKRGLSFFNHVREQYELEGEIIRKEGFSSNMNMGSNRVNLGDNRFLYVGDAAGLVDMYRGLGMDAAALSGRLATRAIIAEKKNVNALNLYSKYMSKHINQTKKNTGKGIYHLKNNDELLAYIKKNMIKMGMKMMFYKGFNKFKSVKNIKLLPA